MSHVHDSTSAGRQHTHPSATPARPLHSPWLREIDAAPDLGALAQRLLGNRALMPPALPSEPPPGHPMTRVGAHVAHPQTLPTPATAANVQRAIHSTPNSFARDLFFREPVLQDHSSHKATDDQHRRTVAPRAQRTRDQELQRTGATLRPRVSRVLQRNTIQRNVGFEFEAGSWTVKRAKRALTPAQEEGGASLYRHDFEPDSTAFNKESILHYGVDWKLKTDTGRNDTHLEFVTDPPGFPENEEGKKRLGIALSTMKSFVDNLIDQRSKATIRTAGRGENYYLAEKVGLNGMMENVLIKPSAGLIAEPQATGGIRLDQLVGLLENLNDLPKKTSSEKQQQEHAMGRSLMWGKEDKHRLLLAESPKAVRNAIAWYQQNNADKIRPPGTKIPPPTPELIGVLSIVRSYLMLAAGPISYLKTIAPLMARTDLGTIFEGVPERQFYRDNSHVFVGIALRSAEMKPPQINEPLFTGKSDMIEGFHWDIVQLSLPKGDWLRSIVAGRNMDLLTERNFRTPSVATYVSGLGGMGTQTDTVGVHRPNGNSTEVRDAPIFEFRRMASAIPHYLWPLLAADVFDWISEINDRKNHPFSGNGTRKAIKKSAKARP